MVILIGGNGYTGKTLLSQKLLERYKIPYLSIDHIKMGLYRGFKDEKYNPEQDSFILGETLWPIIKGIIMTNIENRQNIIIEGCYILPHLIDDFEDSYSKEIVSVFLGFSDNYIRNSYKSKIIKNQSIIEFREEESESMNEQIQLHKIFRQKCLENKVNYLEIDKDYEMEIEKVIKFIDKRTNFIQTI